MQTNAAVERSAAAFLFAALYWRLFSGEGAMEWKIGVNWDERAAAVITYFAKRPELKFGPRGRDKALPLVGDLCRRVAPVTRAELMKSRELESHDDVATILSNVTMAIQGTGTVLPPNEGGWYYGTTIDSELSYIVCPAFAETWRKFRLA